MPEVDWSSWRRCPVCFAPLGDPCLVLTGRVIQGVHALVATDVVRDRPHSVREPRTRRVA